jgi:tetratricopeptide (TPR) repeat protein
LRIAAPLAIAAFTFIIYANAFNVPFLFDDQINITDNPYIRITGLSLDQISRAALQDRFQLRFLSNLTFGLDYYFHGLDKRWMHGENIALHAAAAVLLYFVVYAMIPLVASAPVEEGRRLLISAFAALSWAGHPAHTQAVSYLVQRQTALATAAGLASFLFWIRARESKGRKPHVLYGLSFIAFIISAASKEIGWIVPLFVILFELLFKGDGLRAGKGRAVLLGAAGVFLLGAVMVSVILVATGILSAYLDSYRTLGYGPVARLVTETRVILSYLLTLAWPHPARLALDHEVVVSKSLFSPWTTIPGILLIAGPVLAAALTWRRKPLVAFAVSGFLLALAPESTLIPVELMYDHRMYMASLFVVPTAVALTMLYMSPRKAVPLLAAVILMLGTLTHARNRVWRSELSLWGDSVRKSPGLARPWSNYCAALIKRADYLGAFRSCERAAGLDISEAMPVVNKGVALMHMGRRSEAKAAFLAALRRNPDSALARYNYGAFLETEDRYPEAVIEYKKTLEADVFHRGARFRRAVLLRQMGKADAAFEDLKILTGLYPEFLPGWVQMGFVALDRGEMDLAVKALDKLKRSGRSTPDSEMLERAIRTYSVFGGP